MTGTEPEGPLAQEEPRRPGDFGIDVRRLRTIRLICFGVLAVPLLLLALLMGKFVSMPLTQAWHQGAYSDGEYTEAADRLGPVWIVNWFEPYLPHLTKGTDLLQEGEDAAAEAELRIALEKWEAGRDLNQPIHAQCKILNNLAISIERQAELIEDPGERGDRLFEAEELLAPCGGGGGGGEGSDGGGEGGGEGSEGTSSGNEDEETTEGNGDRIEEKRRAADEEAGKDPDARPTPEGEEGGEETGNGAPPTPGDPRKNDPSGSESPEEAPTEGETSADPKEDELEERNREANEGDGDETSGGTDQDPSKPW